MDACPVEEIGVQDAQVAVPDANVLYPPGAALSWGANGIVTVDVGDFGRVMLRERAVEILTPGKLMQ